MVGFFLQISPPPSLKKNYVELTFFHTIICFVEVWTPINLLSKVCIFLLTEQKLLKTEGPEHVKWELGIFFQKAKKKIENGTGIDFSKTDWDHGVWTGIWMKFGLGNGNWSWMGSESHFPAKPCCFFLVCFSNPTENPIIPAFVVPTSIPFPFFYFFFMNPSPSAWNPISQLL